MEQINHDKNLATISLLATAALSFHLILGNLGANHWWIPLSSPDTPSIALDNLTNYQQSLDFIFQVEGGLSDHPNDHGGRTNMGITEDRAAAHGLTPDEITKEKATEIYRTDYWEAAGCGDFEYPLSMACMNTAVNSGVGKAKEFNALIGDGSVKDEAIAYAQRQEDYYRDIVSRKPDQGVFLEGWLNRSSALKRKILVAPLR